MISADSKPARAASDEVELDGRADLARRAVEQLVARPRRDREVAREVARSGQLDAHAVALDGRGERVLAVRGAVAVAVRTQRIGAEADLGAVVEAVAVGVLLARVGAVRVDLGAVLELVIVRVGHERERVRRLLAERGHAVVVDVLGAVAGPVIVGVGVVRQVVGQAVADLEAVAEPVAVGVVGPRVAAGTQLEHVRHAVAVTVGGRVVRDAVALQDLPGAVGGAAVERDRGDRQPRAPGVERIVGVLITLVDHAAFRAGAGEQAPVGQHRGGGLPVGPKQLGRGVHERRALRAAEQQQLHAAGDREVVGEHAARQRLAARTVAVRVAGGRVGRDGVEQSRRERVPGVRAQRRVEPPLGVCRRGLRAVGRRGAELAAPVGTGRARARRQHQRPDRQCNQPGQHPSPARPIRHPVSSRPTPGILARAR